MTVTVYCALLASTAETTPAALQLNKKGVCRMLHHNWPEEPPVASQANSNSREQITNKSEEMFTS